MSVKLPRMAAIGLLALNFIACSFLAPKAGATVEEIEKEEQAVYSFFVGDSTGTIVIMQDTATEISTDDPQQTIDYIKSGLKSLSDETLDDYMARNKEPGQLSPDMQLGVDYVLLSTDELRKISSQPDWPEVMAERYSGSGGYLILSRVGFNAELDQALIYVGDVAGPLMGAGFYYLLEKRNGEWVLTEQIMVWIS